MHAHAHAQAHETFSNNNSTPNNNNISTHRKLKTNLKTKYPPKNGLRREMRLNFLHSKYVYRYRLNQAKNRMQYNAICI